MNQQQMKDGATKLIDAKLDAIEQKQGKTVREFVWAVLDAHHRLYLVVQATKLLPNELFEVVEDSLCTVLQNYTEVLAEKYLPADTTEEAINALVVQAQDIYDAYVQYVLENPERKAA